MLVAVLLIKEQLIKVQIRTKFYGTVTKLNNWNKTLNGKF